MEFETFIKNLFKKNIKGNFLTDRFPKLRDDKIFLLKSKKTKTYNCISFTLGFNIYTTWPTYNGVVFTEKGTTNFWPKNLPLDESLDNFINMYKMFDYEVCDDDSFEKGYTKIAIFVKNEKVTHASIQINDKLWASKMGELYDIQHQLYSLEGNEYGKIETIMRRRDDIPFSKYNSYFKQ